MKKNRVIIVVLDSVGAGEMPDAELYGDKGANTLGHIADTLGLSMPHCAKLGLGNIVPLAGTPPEDSPSGIYGKLAEKSKGKDTTTGHWEIAGLILDEAFPVYPEGFPDEILNEFTRRSGYEVIGNRVASGTQIIDELGDEHCKSGKLILYTSADSVFQLAAHEEVVALDKLYSACEAARSFLSVGRVIARPFIGSSGNYTRTKNRHDYSLAPTGETILDRVKEKGLSVKAVGKISDIFAGRGVTESFRTTSNMEGVNKTIELLKKKSNGLIFTNLVDFDMEYGHRRNGEGYKRALEEFDSRMPDILSAMQDDDLLIITADHGCDPYFKGTDHTREYVPFLMWGHGIDSAHVGTLPSFSVIANLCEELLLNEHDFDISYLQA